MFSDPNLLALCAVLDTGSFEAAAGRLGITQSAVSQRVRALEDKVGATLLVRSQPAQATEAGRHLQAHAEAVALLEADLQARVRIGPAQTAGAVSLRLAVNADSLETWFLPVLEDLPRFHFSLTIDDQDHTHALLRDGSVIAAVTGTPGPIQGCDSLPLGALRYRATLRPDRMSEWFPEGVTEEALRAAPVVSFGPKDALQSRWAEAALGRPPPALSGHVVPAPSAFYQATLHGLGWGMNPEPMVRADIAAGRLVALGPHLDTPLYWQVRRLSAPALKPLTARVQRAARAALVQPDR